MYLIIANNRVQHKSKKKPTADEMAGWARYCNTSVTLAKVVAPK